MKCEICKGTEFTKEGLRPREDGVWQKWRCIGCGDRPLTLLKEYKRKKKLPSPKQVTELDLLKQQLSEEQRDFRRRSEIYLKEISGLKEQLEQFKLFKDVSTIRIPSDPPNNTSHSTAVLSLSDWHIEEEVKAKTVNDWVQQNGIGQTIRIRFPETELFSFEREQTETFDLFPDSIVMDVSFVA